MVNCFALSNLIGHQNRCVVHLFVELKKKKSYCCSMYIGENARQAISSRRVILLTKKRGIKGGSYGREGVLDKV